MTDAADVLGFFDEPAPEAPREWGPFCGSCGHEYRTKKGEPETIGAVCPYCGIYGAVVARKPFHEQSKSSIELAELCMRRWYYKYIERRQEKKNKWAQWGIDGHEVAENYLKLGVYPQVNDLEPKSLQSKIARSLIGGIPHMPRPNHGGLRVETEFHFEFEGVRYGGYKDYEAPDVHPLVVNAPPGYKMCPIPLVGDHKFTGDLRYALTEYELVHDKQGVIYAWDVMRRSEYIAAVWLNWVYMVRGEQTARPVRALAHRPAVIDGMRKLSVIGRHLTQLRARKDFVAKDYPPNKDACYEYKEQCPHFEPCEACGDRDTIGQIAHVGNEPYRKEFIMTQPQFPPPGVSGFDAILATLPQPPNGAPPAGVVPPAAVQATPAAAPPPTVQKVHVMFPGQSAPLEIPVESLPHLPAGAKVWNGSAWTDPPPAPAAPPAEPKKRGRPAKVTTVAPPAGTTAAPAPPPPATANPVPTGYMPGQVINGHQMGVDGQWRPVMPLPPTPPPAPVAAPLPPTPTADMPSLAVIAALPPTPVSVATSGDLAKLGETVRALHIGDEDADDNTFELSRIADALERIANHMEKGASQ